MHSLYLQNANATTIHTSHFHFPSNPTSILFPNTNIKLLSKPRFQCSIKTKQVTNTLIPKQNKNINKDNKVIILWDLDNKPPRGPPYDAVLSLKTLSQRFGDVVSISAYTKRHSFFSNPKWSQNPNPNPNSILCRVCGHECKSIFDLKIHLKRIHQYKNQKFLKRLRSIKFDRSKVKFIRKEHTYNEAGRYNVAPRVGFELASELRRGGVFVKIVEDGDKVNAADSSLKKEMMSGGIDWLVLVSDDSGFSEMLKKVREMNLRVVVVGDYWERFLGKNADLWLPWNVVENGKVEEMDLTGRTINEGLDEELEEDENLDDELEDENVDYE